MATADTHFVENIDLLMDEFGDTCTIRRPVKLERFDGTAITSLAVKTTAAESATSLILELSDSERLKGSLEAGTILVLASADYTVQADVEVDKASRDITVSISPPLAAEAAAGAAVTIPQWATFSSRFWEDDVSAFSQSGLETGSRVVTIERGSLTIELRGGDNGDFVVDETGTNVGRVVTVTDSSPDGWEAVVA